MQLDHIDYSRAKMFLAIRKNCGENASVKSSFEKTALER
jgi:hypothetical protein